MTTVPLDAYTMADMASEKDWMVEAVSAPSPSAAAAAVEVEEANVAAYASAAAWVGKMPQSDTSEGDSAGPIGGRTAKKLCEMMSNKYCAGNEWEASWRGEEPKGERRESM